MDYSGCRPLGCQNPASLSALTNNLKIVILTIWDDFHLQTVMETVPYFMLAGRQNYTRYTPVYIAEIKELEQTQSLMFEHLMQGLWVGLWFEDLRRGHSIRYQRTRHLNSPLIRKPKAAVVSLASSSERVPCCGG